MAQALYNDPTNHIEDVCRTLHISRKTLYRYVKSGQRLGAQQRLRERQA